MVRAVEKFACSQAGEKAPEIINNLEHERKKAERD
jgi:hypothetical protein